MPGEETHGNTPIAAFLAQNSEKGHAKRRMLVSMHMVFLSPGFILPNTEPGFARMRWGARAKSASLLTSVKNCAPYMLPQVRGCLRQSPIRLVQ